MALTLGVHDNDTASAKRAAQYPGHGATRLFVPGVLSKPIDLVGKISRMSADTWRSGHTAVWSFKPHPAKVADGTWKKPIQDLGRFLKDNQKTKRAIIVIWHEPENDVGPGKTFKTPEEFVKTFNTVHGWLVGEFPGIVTCHAAMVYAYRDNGTINDKQALRWRTKAKLLAADVYSGRSFPLNTIMPELTGFSRWHRALVNGKKWGIAERGWAATAAQSKLRADTITREFKWLATCPKPPELYMIWHSTGVEGDQNLRLDAAGQRAVTDGFKLLTSAGAAVTHYEPPAAEPPKPAKKKQKSRKR